MLFALGYMRNSAFHLISTLLLAHHRPPVSWVCFPFWCAEIGKPSSKSMERDLGAHYAVFIEFIVDPFAFSSAHGSTEEATSTNTQAAVNAKISVDFKAPYGCRCRLCGVLNSRSLVYRIFSPLTLLIILKIPFLRRLYRRCELSFCRGSNKWAWTNYEYPKFCLKP